MTIATFDSDRPNFTPYGFTCIRWQVSRAPRPDRHNEIELNLLESGSFTYLIGGSRMRVEAGQLHVFWAAMPHQILSGESAESVLVATIPLAWFLEWRLPPKLIHSLLQGEVLRNGEPCYAKEDEMMLSRWVDYMEHSPEVMRQVILLEIQARLLRFASVGPSTLSHVAQRGFSANDPTPSKAERLASFVAQHSNLQLSAEAIGRAVDLHPNYATAVFKRTFGITLSEYLTRQRISHAQHLLVATNSNITDVAFNSGFNSISRFNAAFHEICKCSPSNYRRQKRLGERGASLVQA
jgi:AraC-like DNA-binding protein